MKNIMRAVAMSLAVAGFQAPANAQNAQADVIRVLQSQGFDITLQKRTLLGRVKIKATNGEFIREVIILPATGEVLRDILQYASGSKRGQNAWSEFLKPRGNPPDHSAAGGEGKRAGGVSAKPEDPGRSNIPDHANGRPQSSDNDKTDQTSGQRSNTRSNANPASKEKNNRADKVKQAPQDNSSDTQYNSDTKLNTAGGPGNSAKKDAAKSSNEAKGEKNKQSNAPSDKANPNAGGGGNKTNSGTNTKADKQDNSNKKSTNGKSVGKDNNGDSKGNSGNNKNKGDKENRPAKGKSEGAGSSGKDKGPTNKD